MVRQPTDAPTNLARRYQRISRDFSPGSGAAGRAGLQPRRNGGPSGLSVPFPEQSVSRRTARGTGHGIVSQVLVTAELNPRPSLLLVRNPG